MFVTALSGLDLAPLALNKSIARSDCSELSEEFYVEFNLEMLDDTYSTYDPPRCSVFDEDLADGES